ncbi:hypothetical protein [Sinimarinibacterium thermocellulolyticum]|uniref:Uncharacterized protein n=1 Tax=Sinimarinibacterium thermocellulolyticum TaxID=3170016 RepID=A0ABV2ADX1_9GAMM
MGRLEFGRGRAIKAVDEVAHAVPRMHCHADQEHEQLAPDRLAKRVGDSHGGAVIVLV